MICDRCGKDVTGAGEKVTLELQTVGFLSGRRFDLCPKCYKEFEKWVRQDHKKVYPELDL